MLIIIVFIPLLSFLICSVFGRYLGNKGTRIFSTACLILNFVMTVFIYVKFLKTNCNITINLGTWMSSGLFTVDWAFVIDDLTLIMLLVVNFISSLVHLYSSSYMSTDPHICRFMSYLSSFTFFMLILITADNYIQLFLGWEGVGLCSYLLISFWFTRIQANKSALKAIIVNRISDFCLTFGIVMIYYYFRSVDFSISFAIAPFFVNETINFIFFENIRILDIIAILLYAGAVGKSAQILLHTWLPDAMEGPTPVSALIHAATMVTAGVFLIIKCSPIIEYSPFGLLVIGFSGAITSIFAASSGLMQNDIKKVIAYSTCSQLGYMVLVCGLSAYNVALFHLMNHAVFKALLFLCAGSVIHAVGNEQDMRRMGGLSKILPLTYSTMFIGTLAITGFPYLTGFFSKDVILETAFGVYGLTGTFIHWCAAVTSIMTAFYPFRLLYFVFFSSTNILRINISKIHESDFLLAFPLILLSIGSIFVGYLFRDIMIGPGNLFLSQVIFTKNKTFFSFDTEFIPIFVKLIPLLMGFLGLFIFIYFVRIWKAFAFYYTPFINKIINFLSNKWYFDSLYNKYLNIPFLLNAYNWTYKLIDKGLLEIIGPYGFWYTVKYAGMKINNFQTGFIADYLMYMALPAIILIYTLLFY